MSLLQNFRTVIKLSCLSDISDLLEKCSQLRVADVFVDSVFIHVLEVLQ